MDQQPVRDLADVLGRAEPNFRSEGHVTANNMKGGKRRRRKRAGSKKSRKSKRSKSKKRRSRKRRSKKR